MTEASISIMTRGRQRSHALREAFCADCGAQVHWDAPSVTFRRLMRFWERKPAGTGAEV